MVEERRGWAGRVAFHGGRDGFAYRPNEVIVSGRRALDTVSRAVPEAFEDAEALTGDDDDEGFAFFRLRGREDAGVDVIDVVEELRSRGEVAQPNHVVFAHCDCCCGPHPATPCGPIMGSPVYASPVYASSVYASPVYASPVYASPVYASPVYASDLRATGHHKSSARPATDPGRPRVPYGTQGSPRIAILDTGLAGDKAGTLTPALLASVPVDPRNWEQPDEDGDHFLDPAAGHGTFIAGLIEQYAPGCAITVRQVLSTTGDGGEFEIVQALHALAPDVELLNLSFGGYAMETMYALQAGVRKVRRNGTVVVSSAGNDATCRPTFPAAFHGVVAVGGLGPNGPAPFTNYGPWLRACAPGVDLVSAFFRTFDGAEEAPAGQPDPDRFASWATWSGTSFSAPMVVAALAREMQATGKSAPEAVASLVDAPGLARLPNLGTIVNLA